MLLREFCNEVCSGVIQTGTPLISFKSYNFCRLFCKINDAIVPPPWTIESLNLFFHSSNFFFSQYLELEDKINKFLGNFWYCNSWYDKLILGIFQLLWYWNKFDKIVWSVLIAIHENIKKKKKINGDTCLRLLRYVSRE